MSEKILNAIYRISIICVVTGALFKIMHWPGANYLLIIGAALHISYHFASIFI